MTPGPIAAERTPFLVTPEAIAHFEMCLRTCPWTLEPKHFGTLLRAVTERAEEVAELRHSLTLANANTASFQRIATERGERIKELEQQISTHDAQLTEVRGERPQLEEIRRTLNDAKRYSFADHPLQPTDAKEALAAADRLLIYVNDLQLNEARWRNARDVWDAERKRLQETNRRLHADWKLSIEARCPFPEPSSAADAAQQAGHRNVEYWKEACRLFRARCSPEDCSRVAEMRTLIESGEFELHRQGIQETINRLQSQLSASNAARESAEARMRELEAAKVGELNQRRILAGLVDAGSAREAVLEGRVRELQEALTLLVSDVQGYEAWKRPCFALDKAIAALALPQGEKTFDGCNECLSPWPDAHAGDCRIATGMVKP